MEEKNTIKISISTFFLILAVIVIVAMGIFSFKMYNEKTVATEKATELQTKLNELTESVSGLQANVIDTKNINNYSNISGLYEFNYREDKDDGIYYDLVLYENGTFIYEYGIGFSAGIIGNYIISGNTITLNELFNSGSDASLSATNGNIKLIINNNGTITDNNKLLDFTGFDEYRDLSSITLSKANEKKQKEYLKTRPSINELIENYYISNNVQ